MMNNRTDEPKYAPALTVLYLLIKAIEDGNNFYDRNVNLSTKDYWKKYDSRQRTIERMTCYAKTLIIPYVHAALKDAEKDISKELRGLAETEYPQLGGVWLLTDYCGEKDEYDIELIIEIPSDTEGLAELFDKISSIMQCRVRFRLLGKDVFHSREENLLYINAVKEILEGRVRTLYIAGDPD